MSARSPSCVVLRWLADQLARASRLTFAQWLLSGSLQLVEIALEPAEALVPEAVVTLEPIGGIPERAGLDAARPPLAPRARA